MTDDLAAAVRAYEEARAAVMDAQARAEQLVTNARNDVAEARSRFAEAIVDAARDGMRQVDIVRVTGYTRERVRQILRAGGVEAE
ncbi:hypothetical protein ACN26Y_14770 [Micromonospora sp. WMMD558]|uniref:hypothetical protein n=1 Tax=unclassified Micromonospora TaxID=2617518 RepID=UPI0012B4C94D|nr:hypothetical protein [Micromonospora sp. WMMC415]QGN47423.1 hypothetical protein GKC29_11595 [Micromonospora sp. WMMC415]